MDYTLERNNLIDVYNICKNAISNRLSSEIALKVGVEFEFFLLKKDDVNIDFSTIIEPLSEEFRNYTKYKYNHPEIVNISNKIREKMQEFSCEISSFEREDGKNQFEIQFSPVWHPVEICDSIARFRKYLSEIADSAGFIAIFNAKPFAGDMGSAVHVNISLYNAEGVNIFQHFGDFSHILTHALGGLMKNSKPLIYLSCLDDKNAYYRFKRPQFGQMHINYPTNFSWGYNNRTCMIRIPTSVNMDMQNTRIEFRTATPLCNPYKLISGLFFAITDGIVNNHTPPDPLYGNAFDRQYDNLEILPKNLDDALEMYKITSISRIIAGDISIIAKLLPA